MHGEVASVGRDHGAQRTLDVESGQPAALRSHQQHRLDHARQTGLSDLRSQPAGLLFEIGVAVDRDNGQHRALLGAGGGEAAPCHEEFAGNQSGDRDTNHPSHRLANRLPQITTADNQERHGNSLANDQAIFIPGVACGTNTGLPAP